MTDDNDPWNPDDEQLHPTEQWAEDLYRTLTEDYDIPGRATSVIGMGNDNRVYVAADPFSQLEVRLALQNEGYQPRDSDDFLFEIVPDFDNPSSAGTDGITEDEEQVEVLPEYPKSEFDALEAQIQRECLARWDEDDWSDYAPRGHIFEAVRELYRAFDRNPDEVLLFEEHFARVTTYCLLAMRTARGRKAPADGRETRNSRQSSLPQGYPEREFGELERRAVREFNDRVGEHGRGKNWSVDAPHDHIFKAVDELFLARGREEAGDVDGLEEHCANALNHLLFALEISREANESQD